MAESFSRSTLTVVRDGRQHVAVGAGGGDLEGHHHLGAGTDLDGLAGLDAVGGAVHDLAVNEDVAVDHVLTGLGDGTGDPGAQDEGVQTHLEQLDEGLTGQALATTASSKTRWS